VPRSGLPKEAVLREWGLMATPRRQAMELRNDLTPLALLSHRAPMPQNDRAKRTAAVEAMEAAMVDRTAGAEMVPELTGLK